MLRPIVDDHAPAKTLLEGFFPMGEFLPGHYEVEIRHGERIDSDGASILTVQLLQSPVTPHESTPSQIEVLSNSVPSNWVDQHIALEITENDGIETVSLSPVREAVTP